MPRAFLQLVVPRGTPGVSPAGIRFGPFAKPVRIGSDTGACDIVLDRAGNVLPDHAVVTLYPSGVFGVEPRPGAGVWLAIQGQAQLWPVAAPVQCNAGDHLIFGTPGGARLALQLDGTRPEVQADSGPTAGSGIATSGARGVRQPSSDLGSRVGDEFVRQGTVRLLSRVGPARDLYYFYQRASRGSLSAPYVIVSVVFGILAAVTTGTLSCTGILSAVWWKLMHH